MKKLSLLGLFLGIFGGIFAQGSYNMTLHSNWDDSTIASYYSWGAVDQQYNEIWGWHDSNSGREYAIIGSAEGTYFFDVTDPNNIVQADYELGKAIAPIHRDYKTYQNYCYGVADEGASSLQIFDLSFLPDSVHKVYDSDTFCINAHNAFIEGGRLYLCSNNSPSGFDPMRVLDIATNPENPTFLGDLSLSGGQGWHVHDVYVKDDTAYCSNGNDGLYVFDYTNPASPQTIAGITAYPESGYNHCSWMSDDGNTLFFADETHGTGIKSYDVSDLLNISQNTIFRSNVGAMAHNIFVKGDSLYVSYYHDGVWVFNTENVSSPYMVAYYDTYVEPNGYTSYQGCWGVYPWLPSGTILASDFENGLFVLSMIDTATVISGIDKNPLVDPTVKVFPNPSEDFIYVSGESFGNSELISIEIFDLKGTPVISETFSQLNVIKVETSVLNSGIYYIQVATDNRRSKQIKLVVN